MSDPNSPNNTPPVEDADKVTSSLFEPPSVEAVNQELPDYELSTLFSFDRTGALYRGRQPKLDRDICLKLLPPLAGPDQEAYAEAFLHEAKTMASLNHPHIVKVHNFGQTQSGLFFFVMEYVEGSILRREVNAGRVQLEHIFAWVPPVCEALQHAHLQGVVHCDIRPKNILFTNEGEVTVANFGLARVQGQRPEFTSSTVAGVTVSTMDYVAPETSEPGVMFDVRADIYSLGVMIYEMITYQLPGSGYQPVSEAFGVDARFDTIIDGALRPNRESRFQTVMDISGWLSAIHGL
ncbi:MAG: serine/threonine-protein kinase [Verrucomicrobiota bacterium]